jgi:hypothetical protein
MKIATTTAPQVHLPGWSPSTAARLYRIAGLLVAVGVPALFWICALVLLAKSIGIAIGAPVLAAVGIIIAAWCLVCTALVMGTHR